MKKIVCSVFITLLCAMGYAQELPKIIPPTPEIASLGKYTDIPVSLSTGVPNISVPILSLSGKPVNIPVALSYHASGIRVSEVASRNGLGWNISTGGMISVSMRGIPDDEPEGFINTSHTVANYESASASQKALLRVKALDREYDYESDVYNFNFLGQSGKFYINQSTGGVITHEKSDLKFSYVKGSNQKILGWKITTTNGVTYEFGFNTNAIVKETNHAYTKGQNLPAFDPFAVDRVTGWHLTKIVDTFGNTITYTYDRKTTTPITVWNLTSNSKEFTSIGHIGSGGPSNGESTSFSKKQYAPVFLTKIQSDAGELRFEYLHTRQDLLNDKALSSVKLYDEKGALVDEYGFDYGYFTSTDSNQHPNYGIDNQLKKRLYLQRVYQKDGSTQNKIHAFNYNTSQILPNRFSYAQDFWGYYNGKSNAVLYPKTEVSTGSNIVTIAGADRTVNPVYSSACTLKSIIYPTKGKTNFVFEPNTIGRTDDEAFFVGNQYQNLLLPGGQLANQTGLGTSGQTYTSNLTIATDFPYGGIVDYTINVDRACTYSANDCPTISITKTDGTLVYRFNTNTYSGSINLTNGNYILKIENGIFQTDNNVSVSLYGRKLLANDVNAYSGGLRVKEVIFKDYNNNVLNTQTYKYHVFGNTAKSSGNSLTPPLFYYKQIPYTTSCSNCLSDRIESNAIFPLNGFSSSAVTYTNVTQEFSNNGKIESSFVYYADSQIQSSHIIGFSNGTEYPITPALDYSHRRGVLTSEKVFNKGAELIQEKSRVYNPINSEKNETNVNYSVGKMGSYIGTARYVNISERMYLKEEVQKSYSNGRVLEQKTTYTYDSGYAGRTFPTATEVSNSKGEVLKTITRYANDVNNTRLINEHRIGDPIETISYKGGIKLAEQRTIYKDYNGLYLPEKIQTSKGTKSLQDRVVFHSYDNKGNPTEVSKKDGTRIVYIWGYNQTQPVAKIENATLGQVSGYISNIQSKSNLDNDHSIGNSGNEGALRVALQSLRAGLPSAQVTTFTYDPLVGVTSVTDPRGETMYYEYDGFNRLEYVKDAEGNILKENQYNYKN